MFQEQPDGQSTQSPSQGQGGPLAVTTANTSGGSANNNNNSSGSNHHNRTSSSKRGDRDRDRHHHRESGERDHREREYSRREKDDFDTRSRDSSRYYTSKYYRDRDDTDVDDSVSRPRSRNSYLNDDFHHNNPSQPHYNPRYDDDDYRRRDEYSFRNRPRYSMDYPDPYYNPPYGHVPYGRTPTFHHGPTPSMFAPNPMQANIAAYLNELRVREPTVYREWYKKHQLHQKYPGRYPFPPIPGYAAPIPAAGPGSIINTSGGFFPTDSSSFINKSSSKSFAEQSQQSQNIERPSVHSGRSSANEEPINKPKALYPNDPLNHHHFKSFADQDLSTINSYVEPKRMTPVKFHTPHSIGIFTPLGKLLQIKDGGTTIEITSLKQIVQDLPEYSQIKIFPGPLIKGTTHKNNVIQFCEHKIEEAKQNDAQIDKPNFILLWELLILLIKQNGSVVGSDIAELIFKKNKPQKSFEGDGEDSSTGTDIQTVAKNETEINEQFSHLLLYGFKKDALEHAMTNGLWGHALFLASKMDEKTYGTVLARFANGMKLNDPLQTLYQILGGKQPSSVTNCCDESFGDWKPHLAMILSNMGIRPEVEIKSIITLGDTLGSRNFIYAAQFCYLMAHLDFSVDSKLGSLLGYSSTENNTIEATQMTEIYEFARTLGSENVNFTLGLTFLQNKFEYTKNLIDLGFVEEAFTYCEVMAKQIAHISSESIGKKNRELDCLRWSIHEVSERLVRIEDSNALFSTFQFPQWIEDLRNALPSLSASRKSSLTSSNAPDYSNNAVITGEENNDNQNQIQQQSSEDQKQQQQQEYTNQYQQNNYYNPNNNFNDNTTSSDLIESHQKQDTVDSGYSGYSTSSIQQHESQVPPFGYNEPTTPRQNTTPFIPYQQQAQPQILQQPSTFQPPLQSQQQPQQYQQQEWNQNQQGGTNFNSQQQYNNYPPVSLDKPNLNNNHIIGGGGAGMNQPPSNIYGASGDFHNNQMKKKTVRFEDELISDHHFQKQEKVNFNDKSNSKVNCTTKSVLKSKEQFSTIIQQQLKDGDVQNAIDHIDHNEGLKYKGRQYFPPKDIEGDHQEFRPIDDHHEHEQYSDEDLNPDEEDDELILDDTDDDDEFPMNFKSTYPIDEPVNQNLNIPRESPSQNQMILSSSHKSGNTIIPLIRSRTFPVDRKCCEPDTPCLEHNSFQIYQDSQLCQQLSATTSQSQPEIEMPIPNIGSKIKGQEKNEDNRQQSKSSSSSSSPEKKSSASTNSSSKSKKKDDLNLSNSSASKSKGWFGGIFNFKPKNQMILPDDKKKSIVWDENRKKWLHDGEEEDESNGPPPPPPTDSDLMKGSGPPQPSFGIPPQQHQQQQPGMQNFQQSNSNMMMSQNSMPMMNNFQQQQQQQQPQQHPNAGSPSFQIGGVVSQNLSAPAGISSNNVVNNSGPATVPQLNGSTSLYSMNKNKYQLPKGRSLKNSYVDVLNPNSVNGNSDLGVVGNNAQPAVRPSVPNFFIPPQTTYQGSDESGGSISFLTPSNIETSQDNINEAPQSQQQHQSAPAPQMFNPTMMNGTDSMNSYGYAGTR